MRSSSSGVVPGNMQKGPRCGQIYRSGYLGGLHRQGYSGTNPCDSALNVGFFMGGTQTMPRLSSLYAATMRERGQGRSKRAVLQCRGVLRGKCPSQSQRASTNLFYPSGGRGGLGRGTGRTQGQDMKNKGYLQSEYMPCN